MCRGIQIILIAGLALFTSVETSAQQKENETLIEAQALGSALQVLAEEYDLQVLFESAVVANHTATAIPQGTSRDAALGDLLAGTDLTYEFVNERTVAIRGGGGEAVLEGERGNSDSKNLGHPQPVLMAQNQTSQVTTSTETSRSDVGGTSIVTGKVTDARTGTNLKGAKVTITETGQWTSTDDLGEFRFVDVPAGNATLTVSYLGYATHSAVIGVHGDTVSQSFSLRGGSEVEEIVVFGQRSARAQSLNRERTVENSSTVISADLLGNFTGTTISESLRRAPGVAFVRDPATGDGTNIIIRGLAPDLNIIKFNGIELPEGTGEGRSASLGNILTESIDTVVINKTLLPSHDSGGTGGLVEITTKSPLDRPRRFATFTVEGAEREEDFNEELRLGGTMSGLFGSRDQFGLSGSLEYRERENQRLGYTLSPAYGGYLPLQVDGQLTIDAFDEVDPRLAFPFEGGELASRVFPRSLVNRLNRSEGEDLTATATAAWDVADHTNLRFDYTRFERTTTTFSRSWALRFGDRYEPTAIPELGGEVREAATFSDRVTYDALHRFSPNREAITDTYSFQGDTSSGAYDFNYLVGYSEGRNEISNSGSFTVDEQRGVSFDPALISPTAFEADGRLVNIYPAIQPGSDAYPIPQLTADGFAFFNDPNNLSYTSGQTTEFDGGSNERLSFELSGRRNFEHDFLRYIEAGVDFEESNFTNFNSGQLNYSAVSDENGLNPTLADVGLSLSESSLDPIGLDSGFNVVSFSDMERFVRNFSNLPDTLVSVSPSSVPDDLAREEETIETEIAPYLQIALNFGKLELIGGVRYSDIEIETTKFSGPTKAIFTVTTPEEFQEFLDANKRLVTGSVSQTTVLPRLQANYRFDENNIVRASYFQSIARPQIGLIAFPPEVQLLDFTALFPSRFLDITTGNPDLRPTKTDSYELSYERYFRDVGQFEINLFYKEIQDLIEGNRFSVSNDEIPDDLLAFIPDDPDFQAALDNPDDWEYFIQFPTNNAEPADVWGIELVYEQQFVELPGAWSGLGIFTNYTYSDSSKTEPFTWSDSPVIENGAVVGVEDEVVFIDDVPFEGSPEHSGTFGITYNKYGIDANVAYTAQSRRFLSYEPNGLSDYEEAFETLDLRAVYTLDSDYGAFQVYFEGLDLLRDPEDPAIQGSQGDNVTYITRADFLGGRQLRLGLRATF